MSLSSATESYKQLIYAREGDAAADPTLSKFTLRMPPVANDSPVDDAPWCAAFSISKAVTKDVDESICYMNRWKYVGYMHRVHEAPRFQHLYHVWELIIKFAMRSRDPFPAVHIYLMRHLLEANIFYVIDSIANIWLIIDYKLFHRHVSFDRVV